MHGPILNLLFPNAPEGKIILQISSLTIIFTVLEQTINGALQGLGKIIIPAISLSIGVIAKLFLNIILVPIPTIGIFGAAIATTICHAIAFNISFFVLRKNIELNLNFSKFVIKPILASVAMGACSYSIYFLLSGIVSMKMATIIAIILGIIIYTLSIITLKIFTKEEIFMIPYGPKLYKIFEKIKIY